MSNDPPVTQPDAGERLLERHLQHYIAENIQNVLGNLNLELIGTEVQTPAGRIDVLAVERDRCLWVIEMKIGTATRDAVAQLQSYMAAVMDIEEYEDLKVEGILIAETFDEKCRYALRMIENIVPLCYSIRFGLSTIQEDGHAEYFNPSDLEAWVIDLDRGSFHPKNNTKNIFPISDRILVRDLLGNHDIELVTENFSVGKYRKIRS